MRVVKETFGKFSEHYCAFLAGMVAYFSLFSLFPILFFSLFLFALILRGTDAEKFLMATIARVIPGGVDIVGKIIEGRADGVGFSLIGAISSLYGGSGIFTSLEYALNRALGVKTKRGIVRDYAMAFGMTILMGAFAVLAALVQMASALFSHMPLTSGLTSVILFFSGASPLIIGVVIVAVTVVLIYTIVPSERQSWRWLWPGWILATATISALQLLFHLYLRFANLSATYGSMGSVLGLLLWLYYSSFAILLGAELNDARRRLYFELSRTRGQGVR